MFRRQRFRLYPNTVHESYFRQASGAARHAWNWALALRLRYYRRFKKSVPLARLKRQWNKHKKSKKAWAAEVGKVVTATAIHNLDAAYSKFFSGLTRFPRFKKKGRGQSKFAVADMGCAVVFRALSVKLPVVGQVRYRGERRWPTALIKSAVVCQAGGRWFLSVLFELPEPKPEPHGGPTCGIDLGCTTFATIASQGVIVDEVKPPKPYAKAKRKLKRLQRKVSRRQRGGKNRDKAKRAVSAMHWRVANIRSDFLNKLSRKVSSTYSVVVLENLCVKGLARSHLSRSIGDLGFSEFRRQVTYKATETGSEVVIANRFYPSSKTCSTCGVVNLAVILGVTHWTCSCGAHHHRDHNAAMNLEKLGRGTPEVTPAEIGVPAKRKPSRSRSKKQEYR